MEASNMVSIAFSPSLLFSSLLSSSLLSSSLLFSTFMSIKPSPAQHSLKGIHFVVFLELHWVSWSPLLYSLSLRQVWAEGCTGASGASHSSAFYCRHTDKHTHSHSHTSVHKQHTTLKYVPRWHHVHTCTPNYTHSHTHTHTHVKSPQT